MAILQNRLLWLVVALVAAMLSWNLSVPYISVARAQEPHNFPISTGDRVTLGIMPDATMTCVVGEVRGNFLKCAPGKETFTFNQPPRTETWYNLATVRYIDRPVATR
jgi:hypothetical protein